MIESVSKCSYNIHISYFIRSKKVFFHVLWVLSSIVAHSGTQAISAKKCNEILTAMERITITMGRWMRDWWIEIVINRKRFLFAIFKHETSFLKCQLLQLKVEQIPFLIYDI